MNSKKILIITNNVKCYQKIKKILEQEEFRTIAANNSQIALKIAKEQSPELIICELNDPNLDGYQVLTHLRQDCLTATIPLIFLTQVMEVQQWRKGMEMGADDFLLTPVKGSELIKAIAAIVAKKKALIAHWQQELEEIRHSFAYFMPHELRTALTGILAASDLLLAKLECLEPSVVREMISCINGSSQRLNRLIQNILFHSELELISKKPEQINHLCQDKTQFSKILIEEIALYLTNKNNRQADLYLEVENACVSIGKNLLTKLVEELIDNACKFSPQGTPIKITTRTDKDRFILQITDYGRGMSVQQIASIGAYMQFERQFYEQQGSGLGLAIAKQLAQIHGGQLIVDSILFQGTNVTVLLPLVKSPSSCLTLETLDCLQKLS